MKHQRELRRRLLLALYHQSDGKIDKNMCVGDVAHRIGEDERVLEVVAEQLIALDLLKLVEPQCDPFAVFNITMRGIEEAEKMNESFFRRMADEYPFLYQACWSIVTLIVGALLLWLLGLQN